MLLREIEDARPSTIDPLRGATLPGRAAVGKGVEDHEVTDCVSGDDRQWPIGGA